MPSPEWVTLLPFLG